MASLAKKKKTKGSLIRHMTELIAAVSEATSASILPASCGATLSSWASYHRDITPISLGSFRSIDKKDDQSAAQYILGEPGCLFTSALPIGWNSGGHNYLPDLDGLA